MRYRSIIWIWVLVVATGLMFPMAGAAQQGRPTQQQLDSLRAQLRALQLRLDSLLSTMKGSNPLQSARDTTNVVDELTALRAAAAGAAGRDTLKADTAESAPFVGRERNLSQLNPEISATGDVRAYAYAPNQQRDNFSPREFEVSFQAALDPYSHTKIFVALEDGEVDIEEAYAYWTSLPGRVRVDFGKFRQLLGELNRWHLHALPETEYPLVIRRFAGEDGLAGTGLSLYWTAPIGGKWGVHEFTLQPTAGSNEVLFQESNRPALLGHLNNFWQLTPSTFFQIGGTALIGSNDEHDHTRMGGLDARVTWRPPKAALYREFTIRGEVLALQPSFDPDRTFWGGYLESTYRLDRRWIAGARFDLVQDFDVPRNTFQFVPSITMWQSEWVYLRGEYTYTTNPVLPRNQHQFALQAVWSIGPHKHEIY